MAGIAIDQFADHQLHGRRIRDDMVLSQHQHLVVGRQLQQTDPQQRAAGQVERLADLLSDTRLKGRLVRQSFMGDDQRSRALDHLDDALVAFDEASTQGLMTLDQRIEAVLQRRTIEAAFQAQDHGDVVGAAVWLQLPEEPLALLGIGHRQRRIARRRPDGRSPRRQRRCWQAGDEALQAGLLEQRLERCVDA